MKKFSVFLTIGLWLPSLCFSQENSDNFSYSSPNSSYQKIISEHKDTSNIQNTSFIRAIIKTRVERQIANQNGYHESGAKAVAGVYIGAGSKINGDININIENHENINVLSE